MNEHDFVIEYLARRDTPCPVCGYNARGNTTGRCSECGARLELCVASDHVRTGPWALLILAAAVPMGYGVVYSTVSTMMILTERTLWSREGTSLISTSLLAATFGCILVGIVAGRRRLWRLAPALQWRIAIGAAAIFVFVELGVMLATIK